MTIDPKTREDILFLAKECVCGQRQQDYGTPENSFNTIAKMWNAYIGYRRRPLDARDVAAMLALLKIARISTGQSHIDNWVDLAGYAACGGEIECESQYSEIGNPLQEG